MRQHNRPTTISFTGALFVLFFTFWSCQALASENSAIHQRIQDQLTGEVSLGASKVLIHVEDGFVLLTGTVHRYLHKMNIEKISWKTTGVAEVENEIEVKSLFPLSDTVIEKKVRTLLVNHQRFHGGKHLVRVAGGVVAVTGVFFQPRDVQFLKRNIAEIEGVVDIKIHATALLAEGTIAPN